MYHFINAYVCLLLFLLFAYNKQEKSQLFPVIAVLSQNDKLGVKLQSTEIKQNGQLSVRDILVKTKSCMLYIEFYVYNVAFLFF